MMRRLGVVTAATALLLVGQSPGAAAATETAGKWCKTYCDAIHVGCQKTIGWLDEDACEEWHRGCLDGCAVNERQ